MVVEKEAARAPIKTSRLANSCDTLRTCGSAQIRNCTSNSESTLPPRGGKTFHRSANNSSQRDSSGTQTFVHIRYTSQRNRDGRPLRCQNREPVSGP